MYSYFLLPLYFLKFWFFDAPGDILGYFISLNKAFFELFSLPLYLKTFYKPLKNEYRQGLVGFSRVMGMGLKSVLIVIDLGILVLLLSSEFLVLFFFIAFPVFTAFLLLA